MLPRSHYKVITDEVRAIRALREKKGLSVNKAAPLIGTNKSTLTALENGRINLTNEWIEKILKAYRFTLSSFEEMKELQSNSKDEVIKEIVEQLLKMKPDKLETIKLLVRNFQ